MEWKEIVYNRCINEGFDSLMDHISNKELIPLLGAFNGLILTESFLTSERIRSSIAEYDRYDASFQMNCENLGINHKQLLEKVSKLTQLELFALLDYAMRFWESDNTDQQTVLATLNF